MTRWTMLGGTSSSTSQVAYEPQIMKAQCLSSVAGHVFDRLRVGAEDLDGGVSVVSDPGGAVLIIATGG
jgi:hypothetical protein